MRSEAFYRGAARAAWVAPLAAFLVNYCTKAGGSASEPKVQLVSGLTCSALVLVGFLCSIVALRGAARYRRAGIIIPGLFGFTINGLAVVAVLMVLHLAGKVSRASAAIEHSQYQATAERLAR